MTNHLLYVYCISKKEPGPEFDLGLKGLVSIKCEDLYVIVKFVSEDEFSEENFKENVSDPRWLESHARDHVEVIGEMMKFGTAIPFKFGTLYRSEESLGQFVKEYYPLLTRNLLTIEGKEEWEIGRAHV